MELKFWQTYSTVINGFSTQARFEEQNRMEIFVPLVHRLGKLQQKKGMRLVVFLAAPPGAGKSTLADYLSHLAREEGCPELASLGLDGFHYHQDYILSHSVAQQDGTSLPMQAVKGSPETYDVPHFQKKLKALLEGNPLWPIYDRQLHDVKEEQLAVTAPIVLIEGNWLLLDEMPWKSLSALADYTIFVTASEAQLKERLIQRKIRGGLTQEEALAFYETGDGVNVRRVLNHNLPAHLTLTLEADGSYTIPFASPAL